MKIEDIIGKGKAFEPPFSASILGGIYDKNRKKIFEPCYIGHYERYFEEKAVDAAIAMTNHIVELLNERWKDETTTTN